MNALMRINQLRKLAKAAGIEGYRSMKLHELEALGLDKPTPELSDKERTKNQNAFVQRKEDFINALINDDSDPFDEIDPEIEGDHLDIVEESKVAKAERDATREAWLLSAVDILRTLLKQNGARVPERIAVSVGFPGTNARKRVGECWVASATAGGINQMFISPLKDDPIEVLGILVHELIHAADNCASGHTGFFSQVAKSVGLIGKMTATQVGEDLAVVLKDIADELGPYPHIKLNMGQSTHKKQTTRLIKVQCNDPECGMPMRVTSKWIAMYAEKTWVCPCGEGELIPA